MYEGIEGALLVSLIAMSIVFIVLGLLALLMVGLRKIIGFSSQKISKEKKTFDITPKDIGKAVKTEIIADEEKSENIVAIISAAVVNYISQTSPMRPVNVISIRRIMPLAVNPWAISGKQNMIEKRLSFSNRIKGGF